MDNGSNYSRTISLRRRRSSNIADIVDDILVEQLIYDDDSASSVNCGKCDKVIEGR